MVELRKAADGDRKRVVGIDGLRKEVLAVAKTVAKFLRVAEKVRGLR